MKPSGPSPATVSLHMPTPLFDLVIDVRDEDDFDGAAMERRLLGERFDHVAGQVTALLPSGATVSSAGGRGDLVRVDVGPEGLGRAIGCAVEWHRHLLVASAGTIPSLDCIGRLIEAFGLDPMIGFAVPRFATLDGEDVFPLTANVAKLGLPMYPRKLLPCLPDVYLCPEVLPGVVLMRRETLTGLRKVDTHLPSTGAALLAAVIQGRRLGYRAAIVNRAVTPAASREIAYPALDDATLAMISTQYPCHSVAETWYAALSVHRREAVLAGAIASRLHHRPRLLLDIRGLRESHNGTSAAILGIVDGFAALECDWDIDLLASANAAGWHNLPARYPRFPIVFDTPGKLYTVAIRLSQPWSIRTLAELHSHALKIVAAMLDTIMWDVIYPCTAMGVVGVAATWEFAATYLDGLLFISDYSRQRFNFRFPAAPHVRQVVSNLSFAAADYVTPSEARHEGFKGEILIFGNDYDHKWVGGALEWIADGFPLATIVAFGVAEPPRPNVRAVPSGQLPDDEMKQLYADAKILCFPSFYEGFGLPIIEGLAHGLDVVARRSGLLEEIASQYRGPGRILPFDDPLSLIECIGRSLAGADVETLPLGTGIPDGQPPMGWKGVAARIMALVDEIAAEASPRVYDSREAALRMLWPSVREPS